MKKVSLLIALAFTWSAAPLMPPAVAQDTFGIDSSGYNHLLNYAQIKHKSPGALDPLSVRNRYLKRKDRTGRTNRRYRRPRATYRATRRTSYRSRR